MKLKIEYVEVNKLVPYEKNTRIHKDYDVSQIMESINQFGFVDPVGIWKGNVIIEGHGRVEAAKKLGLDKVPCIRLDNLTDEQRRSYAIIHNKTAEYSFWNFEMLKDELADLDDSAFNVTFDLPFEVPEEDVNYGDKNGEINLAAFDDEKFKYVCPDCGFKFNK